MGATGFNWALLSSEEKELPVIILERCDQENSASENRYISTSDSESDVEFYGFGKFQED